MSAYDYSDRAKPASAHTKAVNAQLAHELGLEGDAPAWRELELAREGLVRAAEDLVIRDGDGHVIWDLDAFRFLQSPVPDERVNPSLWMNGRANLIAGLFEVVPEKIYQVRGFDLANLTLVRSQTGWIVLDCTTNVETARAAMAFASETLGEDIPARVRAVIISHSHLDHYGGLRGVTVIDSCSTKADALTTALFVMGLDKGMKFCEENKIAAVFITWDKQVYTTSKTGDYAFEFLGEKKGYNYAE